MTRKFYKRVRKEFYYIIVPNPNCGSFAMVKISDTVQGWK